MKTNGQTIGRHEVVIPHVDLQSVQEWVRAAFSKERMAEIGLVAATLVATFYLGSVLFKGIETYSMSGF